MRDFLNSHYFTPLPHNKNVVYKLIQLSTIDASIISAKSFHRHKSILYKETIFNIPYLSTIFYIRYNSIYSVLVSHHEVICLLLHLLIQNDNLFFYNFFHCRCVYPSIPSCLLHQIIICIRI